MSKTAASFPGYVFSGRIIEPRLCGVEETGAAVIVNSIGSLANFRNQVAQSILQVAGQAIKQQVQEYRPLKAGGVLITHAGTLATARYIFHGVVTDLEAGYRANPNLIVRVTTRCIQLADLLDQPSIAMPIFGAGLGRARPEESIRRMLDAVVEQLGKCQALGQVIFATPNKENFALFNNRALAVVALARQEDQLKQSLRDIPPALYGVVGSLLQKLEAARLAGDSADAQELAQQAEGLVRLGRELEHDLKLQSGLAPGVIQMIIATGGSIVKNVRQVAPDQ